MYLLHKYENSPSFAPLNRVNFLLVGEKSPNPLYWVNPKPREPATAVSAIVEADGFENPTAYLLDFRKRKYSFSFRKGKKIAP